MNNSWKSYYEHHITFSDEHERAIYTKVREVNPEGCIYEKKKNIYSFLDKNRKKIFFEGKCEASKMTTLLGKEYEEVNGVQKSKEGMKWFGYLM